MTIDEAFALVGQAEYYQVVWRFDTGEITSVTALDEKPGKMFWSQLRQSLKDSNPPLKGTFFKTAKLTWEALEDITQNTAEREAQRRHEIATRQAILNRWANQPAEQLLDILETASYEWPMGSHWDMQFLMEHLFYFHHDDLKGSLKQRLHHLAARQPPFPEIEAWRWALRLNFELRVYLATLDHDTDTLFDIWRETSIETSYISDMNWALLMECYAFAGGKDAAIIDDLVEHVEHSRVFFFHRYEAMLNLGRIGAAAGSRAVEVIRAVIYDSSPTVTALRERVCERISIPDSAWTPCPHCYHGYVLGAGDHSFSRQICRVCLGIGFVAK